MYRKLGTRTYSSIKAEESWRYKLFFFFFHFHLLDYILLNFEVAFKLEISSLVRGKIVERRNGGEETKNWAGKMGMVKTRMETTRMEKWGCKNGHVCSCLYSTLDQTFEARRSKLRRTLRRYFASINFLV